MTMFDRFQAGFSFGAGFFVAIVAALVLYDLAAAAAVAFFDRMDRKNKTAPDQITFTNELAEENDVPCWNPANQQSHNNWWDCDGRTHRERSL